MALKAADRIKETTEVVGSGNVTLTGAVIGFRSVISSLAVGDSHDFCIDSGGAEWEVSTCTLVSSTVLTRNTVKASSSGGTLVNFSAGTKQVFLMPSAVNGLINASLAKMAANTVKANITGSSADPADVAKTSFVSWLALTAGDVSGVASAAAISAVGYSGQYADILSKPVLASVATSGSASDLVTGTLPAARLPNPTSTSLGGIQASTGTAGQFVSGITTGGAATYGTPSAGTGGSALALTAAPSDQGYTGITVSLTYGESLTPGTPVYIKASDGAVYKADANGSSTYPAIGLAMETASSGTHVVLLNGIYRDDSLFAWTVGGLIYLSGTVGALTQTQPSATDDVIQVIGIATHADRMYVNPQLNYFTHT